MRLAGMTYAMLNEASMWQKMDTITLDEMRSVKLMNRIDTKYVLSEEEVMTMLEHAAKEGYRVQTIGEVRAARYNTIYFDTPERSMYLAHHNRQFTRQKIRTRTYVETGASFLEVKNKTNRGRTKKLRTEIESSELHNFSANNTAVEFIRERSWHSLASLSPALATRFVRITLVNPQLTERLTIDLKLEYEDLRSGKNSSIESMAIVELKQDGNTTSTMKRIMRDMRIQPLKVSKYCLGTSLTVANIKHNRFKLKLREIEKRLASNSQR